MNTTYTHEASERREERPVARITLPPRCPELDQQMDKYLLGRDLDPLLARFNVWYASADAGDRLPRIVMPGVNKEGFPFWQARAMVPAEKRYQSPHASRQDSVILTYPFSSRPRPVVVVEGPMDALAASGAGYVGVALMGNTPPGEVFDLIRDRFIGREVIALPDRDSEAQGGLWLSELALRGMMTVLVRVTDVLGWGGEKDLAALPVRARAFLLSEALRA